MAEAAGGGGAAAADVGGGVEKSSSILMSLDRFSVQIAVNFAKADFQKSSELKK
jgi:hypothetical protein